MPIIDFKAAECRHCYRCIRSCEVKSITFHHGHAYVMPNRCVLCGQCLVSCPQSAKKVGSELDLVKEMLAGGERVVLSLSPSYLGIFGWQNRRKITGALLALGFAAVRNAAEGAALETEAYVELLQEGKAANIITSACPSVINLVEKYYPSLIPYMAPMVIPSGVHAQMLRREFGAGTRVVYLGSCVAEKDRHRIYRPDAVLTFPEVMQWLRDEGVDFRQVPDGPEIEAHIGNNVRYAMAGGLLHDVEELEAAKGLKSRYRKLYASGMADCMEICRGLVNGSVNNCFIELDACHGGCINGPETMHDRSGFEIKMEMEQHLPREGAREDWLEDWRGKVSITRGFKDRSVPDKIPTEEQLREILARTGKNTPEQELNCGACGYPTCRDKAVAVFNKKAELSMCIPYLHERASSLSHLVMETAPNAIVVIDEELRILDCSNAVASFFRASPDEVKGTVLGRYMDTADVESVFRTRESVQGKRVIYPDRGMVTFQNIAYIPESRYVILTIIDVTEEEKHAEEDYRRRKTTIDMAQDVIYRQMRVAQQIAGLLGETTAETQTTLNRLCALFETENESEVR